MNLRSLMPKIASGALCALVLTSLPAQTVTPTAPAATKPPDDVVRLSEFAVSAEPDRGYVASETLTGSRVRTPIIDLPSR